MSGIAITRTDLTAEDLRAAPKAASVPAARRMPALALALDGADCINAARACGITRRPLCDRVRASLN